MSRLGDIQRASNNATSVNPGGTAGIYSGPTKDKFGYGTSVPEGSQVEVSFQEIEARTITDYGKSELGNAVLNHYLETSTYVSPDMMTDEIAKGLLKQGS